MEIIAPPYVDRLVDILVAVVAMDRVRDPALQDVLVGQKVDAQPEHVTVLVLTIVTGLAAHIVLVLARMWVGYNTKIWKISNEAVNLGTEVRPRT